MEKLPISVFIITKNEEERLPDALRSVDGWVDEIIVVDSGSEDETVKLANAAGATVFYNEWKGYGRQKIFGESKCKNKWVLNIDADEIISDELKKNIFKLFENGAEPKNSAYEIKWKMIFLGQEKPPMIATGGNIVRFYNKERAGFRDSTIHDSVILKNGSDKIKKLDGLIYHRCFKNLKHWMEKINFYTTEQAEEWLAKGRKQPSVFRFMFEPFLAFLKCYFQRKYFAYGVDGFNASIFYAYSKVLRLAKVREKYKLKDN